LCSERSTSSTDHLDFGGLTLLYDGLFYNTTKPNIIATMYPTTVVEIGEGFVIGRERTVTKRSGRYSPPAHLPALADAYVSSTLFVYQDCYELSATKGAGLDVAVQLAPGQIAVIVWTK
jgi:hypothetical protein